MTFIIQITLDLPKSGVNSCLRTLQLPLPALTELSAMSADELRATFLRQAEALKSNAPVGVDVPAGAWLQHAADYINKACLLADKIAITTEALACRNGAWSAPKECERLIPVSWCANPQPGSVVHPPKPRG